MATMGSTAWASRLFRVLGVTALALSLGACGGGGGGGVTTTPDTGVTTSAVSATVKSGTVQIDQTQVGLITIASDATGNDVLTLNKAATGPLAGLQAGNTVYVPPGLDSRFPLGVAGIAGPLSSNTTGQTRVTLEPATLAEVFSQSSIQQSPVTLAAENFVGAIAPLSISGGTSGATPRQVGLLKRSVSALNGALVVSPADPGFVDRLMTGVSFFPNGTLNAGEIKLNTTLQLAELFKDDPSRLKPYGSSGKAEVVVSITLSDLKLTENHEYKSVVNVPYALKSMDLKLEGKIKSDIKFSGGAEASFGYFSRAWNEVAEASVSLLGVSGKLTGLDSKDKVGKYPLAGLVFSVPCVGGCVVVTGTTQTPLRLAQAGGAIIWLYLDASGNVTFDGDIGARANADLSVGIQQPEGETLQLSSNIKRASGLASSDNFLEAPYLEGTVSAQLRAGVSIDADVFALGVRIANAAVDLVGQDNLEMKGSISNALPDLGQEWRWVGNACLKESVGAGVILSASIGIGGEIDTTMGAVSGGQIYKIQSPTDAEMLVPGSHTTLGIPTWYTFPGNQWCFPKPVVQSVDVVRSPNLLTLVVHGTNLPDDLSLNITTAGVCVGPIQSIILVVDSGTRNTFSCQTTASISDFNYLIASVKASNLDMSAVSGQWKPASPLPAGFISQGGLTWAPVRLTANFVDANAYCTKAAINGQTGWRMAEHRELIELDISGAMKESGWFLGDTWSSTLPYQSYLDYLYTQGVPVGSPIHIGVILGSGTGALSWGYDNKSIKWVSCVR